MQAYIIIAIPFLAATIRSSVFSQRNIHLDVPIVCRTVSSQNDELKFVFGCFATNSQICSQPCRSQLLQSSWMKLMVSNGRQTIVLK
jgi:hypothetical protein